MSTLSSMIHRYEYWPCLRRAPGQHHRDTTPIGYVMLFILGLVAYVYLENWLFRL